MWFGKKSSARDRRILPMSKALNCATLWTMFKQVSTTNRMWLIEILWLLLLRQMHHQPRKPVHVLVKENFSRVLEQKMGCLSSARATWGCPYQQGHPQQPSDEKQEQAEKAQKHTATETFCRGSRLKHYVFNINKCSSQRNCYGNFNSLIPSAFLTFK